MCVSEVFSSVKKQTKFTVVVPPPPLSLNREKVGKKEAVAGYMSRFNKITKKVKCISSKTVKPAASGPRVKNSTRAKKSKPNVDTSNLEQVICDVLEMSTAAL